MTNEEVQNIKKQVGMVKYLIDRAHLAITVLPSSEYTGHPLRDLEEAKTWLEPLTKELHAKK